jgi:hypothetical protein
MEIGNTNYTALLHVILFIFGLFILATSIKEKEDE